MAEPSLLDWKLQFGAFAISGMLIAMLVWYIRFNTRIILRLFGSQQKLFKSHEQLQTGTNEILREANEAIIMNNNSITELRRQMDKLSISIASLEKNLDTRPCLLAPDVQQKLQELYSEAAKSQDKECDCNET